MERGGLNTPARDADVDKAQLAAENIGKLGLMTKIFFKFLKKKRRVLLFSRSTLRWLSACALLRDYLATTIERMIVWPLTLRR